MPITLEGYIVATATHHQEASGRTSEKVQTAEWEQNQHPIEPSLCVTDVTQNNTESESLSFGVRILKKLSNLVPRFIKYQEHPMERF